MSLCTICLFIVRIAAELVYTPLYVSCCSAAFATHTIAQHPEAFSVSPSQPQTRQSQIRRSMVRRTHASVAPIESGQLRSGKVNFCVASLCSKALCVLGLLAWCFGSSLHRRARHARHGRWIQAQLYSISARQLQQTNSSALPCN